MKLKMCYIIKDFFSGKIENIYFKRTGNCTGELIKSSSGLIKSKFLFSPNFELRFPSQFFRA